MGTLEKKGIETKRGDYNRKVRHENATAEILALENDSFDLEGPDAEPQNQHEKGQIRHGYDFLTADQKPDNGQAQSADNGKEGVLGAFQKENKDTEDLAVASLEASKALHEAAIHEYLQLIPQQTSKEQLLEKVRLAEYARLTTEKLKAPGQRAERQLDHSLRQTEQARKEREDDLER